MYGYWKFVLRMGTTVALLAGTATLMTTQASAQFNIEGIVRGAISQGCCGGGYSRRHYGGVHKSRHGHRSKSDEADDEDSSKGKDDKASDTKTDTKADVKPASAVSRVDYGPTKDSRKRRLRARRLRSRTPTFLLSRRRVNRSSGDCGCRQRVIYLLAPTVAFSRSRARWASTLPLLAACL